MHTNVPSFCAYAQSIGRAIQANIPRSRAHLPAIGAHVDVYTPDGAYLGSGPVIDHDDDPHYLAVSIGGEGHVVHYTDVDWSAGGAA